MPSFFCRAEGPFSVSTARRFSSNFANLVLRSRAFRDEKKDTLNSFFFCFLGARRDSNLGPHTLLNSCVRVLPHRPPGRPVICTGTSDRLRDGTTPLRIDLASGWDMFLPLFGVFVIFGLPLLFVLLFRVLFSFFFCLLFLISLSFL